MIEIRYVTEADRPFWFSLDKHIGEAGFTRKVRDRMGYVLSVDGQPAGVLRWSLFWDSLPFCNLLYIDKDHQRRGCGRALMEHWERAMRAEGHGLVLTSTQADESAQFFYRALGYKDCGGLTFPFKGYEQPMELIMAKEL